MLHDGSRVFKTSLREHFRKMISKIDQHFKRIIFKKFFMSTWYFEPFTTAAMFLDGSKFWEHFLKRVIQGTLSESISVHEIF